jgi:hypothetical protein
MIEEIEKTGSEAENRKFSELSCFIQITMALLDQP